MDCVAMNEELAAWSETRVSGVGLAAGLRKHMQTPLLGSDLPARIITLVTAAAENRLDGCPKPTMSSSGAGTKGLVVILPISETARAIGADRLQTVRALALGHLINRCINLHSGRLSPLCTCVLAASTAAAAGIAWLLGGGDETIGHAIRNMSGCVAGMVCDGGKVGCALKVAAGSVSALLCALTAIEGAALRPSDGICGETGEESIRNMCRIGRRGMEHMNEEILDIMLEKRK